ncbi:MAG: MMPL family transporter [Roseburia sp.]|nr:MMPL family transporter [Roseburia sp.]
MQKLANFIVRKRFFILAVFVAVIVYCIFGIPKVKVEYDISAYLPRNTDTSQALEIMDGEFVSYDACTIMVKDIGLQEAGELAEAIKKTDGVVSFSFDGTENSYKDGNALFSMSLEPDKAEAAYYRAVDIIDSGGYDYVVPTSPVDNYADTLASEMVVIIAIAAAVIIAVLLFTSKSFAEVIAFPVVFVVAAVLNMGTNYWLGTISFVSNTVCIILQLALAIDYAIILCHRFTEEKEKTPNEPKDALVRALSKAIPEIASSSLTTVSGLVALMFMQLRLGFDLGMVLAKSIVCSLITVFFLMPCLLLWLSKPMDRTRHRNFVPKIRFWGRGVIKARYFAVAVFAALLCVGAALGSRIEYCYSQNAIDTSRPTAQKIAQTEKESIFGYDNMFVIIMPNDGDHQKQRELLNMVASDELIDSAQGIASIEITDGVYITDSLTYEQFASSVGEAFELDGDTVLGLYLMYARDNGEAMRFLLDPKSYSASLLDLFEFVFDNKNALGLSDAQTGVLGEYEALLKYGKSQLVGTEHVRLVFNIAAPVEGEATFAMIDRLSPKVKAMCPNAVFAGSSMSAYDLNASFSHDNILITLLTIAFIYVILALTFRSPTVPLVLVAVIQGAIFINFALPVVRGRNLFFFTYLIVSAIQMGATIDYAILLTNRFSQLKKTRGKREALTEAVSAAFPTIATSGTIMTVAAFLVGLLTSDPLISSMGMMLGSGTLISVVCVMTALPALLFLLDRVLEKTTLHKRLRAKDITMPNPSDIPFDRHGRA